MRSKQSQARTVVRHYYLSRLASKAFWRKLLRGEVALSALRELLLNVRRARDGKAAAAENPDVADCDFVGRMAAAWRAFQGPVLLVLSGEDYTAREFVEVTASDTRWSGLLGRADVQRLDIAHADHTFSATVHREALERASIEWLARQGWTAPAPQQEPVE
ncbi:MAG: hypothetical protein JNJ42_15965 [Burkholderiaceae bacterium]|nr:hypothetical protein [Burkholderiaceae bacterium]